MLLATLVIEREPMRWQDLPPARLPWLQKAGTLASLGLLLYFLLGARGSFARMFRGEGRPTPGGLALLGRLFTLASWGLYLAVAGLFVARWLGLRAVPVPGAYPDRLSLGDWLFAAAGSCALL